MSTANKGIDGFGWLRFLARLFSADYRTSNGRNNNRRLP
jgi:hypothetical protein